MKKILLSGFLGLSLLFSACNPYEDIQNQLDADLILKTENDAIPEMISLDSTYATEEEAEIALQKYMTVTYDKANKFTEGKVVEVEYNLGLIVDQPEAVKKIYTVKDKDYESVGNGAHHFDSDDDRSGEFPSGTTVENILDAKIDFILKKNLSDAEEGDRIGVEYKYYNKETYSRYDRRVVYSFTEGTWERYSNPDLTVYMLTKSDYEAMGAPGSHHNFSSSVPPSDYLPQFLKENYPYIQKGEAVTIIYFYFLGKVDGEYKSEYRANEYTFNGTVWMQTAPLNTTIRSTVKFKYSDGEWKVSKAKVIILSNDDYDLVDSGKYHNFAYYDNKAGEYPIGNAVDNIMIAKITTILNKNYKDLAVEDSEVIVTFNYYDSSNTVETVTLIYQKGEWVVTDSSVRIK